MTISIEDLISQTAIGNRDAFRQLYDRTSAKLLGVCLRILNDRAEAEDALQEVFVKVWHRASVFQASRARGITWLAAIARNHSIDRVRARRPASRDIDEVFEVADDAPSPETAAISASENRRVEDCLEELGERHSQAVRNTYLAGWTYQECADKFGVPLNTMKTWLRRSLIALRECMNR